MINATFSIERDDLARITGIMKCTVDNAYLKFDGDGIFSRFMDASHVSMVEISGKDIFAGYVSYKEAILDVPADRMHDIVRKFPKGPLTVSVFDEKIEMRTDGNVAELSVKNIDRHEFYPVISQEYPKRLIVNLKDLLYCMRRVNDVSDYVTIRNEKGTMTLSGSGDSGKMSTAVESISEGVTESVECDYSLEYIIPVLRTGRPKDEIVLEYDAQKPLKVDMGNGIKFWLAPRVGN